MRLEPWEISSERERPIRGEVRHPARATGAVLIVHGFKGFAHWGFFPLLAEALARAGLRTITFDLSGSGVGADRERFESLEAFRENTYTRELEDVASVERLALAQGWIEDRYGLVGHSRGGGMAVLHAARSTRVAALVTWAAIARVHRWSASDVARWRERGALEVVNARTKQVMPLGLAMLEDVERNAASTLHILGAASRVAVPWLILHGAADESVPVDEARELHEASGARAELRVIDAAGHTFGATHPLGEIPATLARVVTDTTAFLQEHLA